MREGEESVPSFGRSSLGSAVQALGGGTLGGLPSFCQTRVLVPQ